MKYAVKLILSSIIFITVFVLFFHSINAITQDLGRHLLTGKIILETQNIPKINLFSYTYPDFPFINHHWLSEVIFYLISQALGLQGLLVVMTLIAISAFSLILFTSYKGKNIIAIFIASLLYLRILSERTDLRPEIFSFLFLAIFVSILYRNREKFTRWVFILPFIELLWINMHIYFPIGIAVLGLFIIDGAITGLKSLKNKASRLNSLIFIFITSSLVTLLNPNVLNGTLYPFKVFQNYGYAIEENQNIIFLWNYSHKPTILFFSITAALLFFLLALNIKRTKPIDWFLAIFFTYLAATAIRNFPLFVFGTYISFVSSLSFLSEKISQYIKNKALIKNTGYLMLIILGLWQITNTISNKQFGWQAEQGAKSGADFLIKQNIKGPIFNNFDIGSYLEYRLYPKEKVFVDGRPESYPADFFQKTYIPMQLDKDVFTQALTKYKFNTIFFSHTDQTPWAETFLQTIVKNNEWTMVYLDEYVVIFVKNGDINKKIIERFSLSLNKTIDLSSNNINSLLRFANFFNLVGYENQQLAIYQKILSIDSNSCPVLYNLSILLSRKKDPAAAIYINKFQNQCR